MVITVTQAHIDAGVPRHCMHCMLGNAIFEQVIQPSKLTIVDWSVLVYDVYIEWVVDRVKHTGSVELPQEAVELAKLFDAGHAELVRPFSFELDIDNLLNGGAT